MWCSVIIKHLFVDDLISHLHAFRFLFLLAQLQLQLKEYKLKRLFKINFNEKFQILTYVNDSVVILISQLSFLASNTLTFTKTAPASLTKARCFQTVFHFLMYFQQYSFILLHISSCFTESTHNCDWIELNLTNLIYNRTKSQQQPPQGP